MALFASCRSSSPKTEIGADDYVEMIYPIAIDIHKGYEVKPFDINEAADIEYIPLETRDDVLLDGRRGLSVSDSLIAVYSSDGTMFIFGRDGRFKTQFNRKGRGPNEYQSISSMAIDFEKKEVYIYDSFLKYKMLVYSINGDFKRSFSVPHPLWIRDLRDYNDEFLLVYTTLAPSAVEKHKGSFTPYYLMSKNDGKLEPLNIQVPRMEDGIRTLFSEESDDGLSMRGQTISTHSSPLIANGKDFYISDFALDTLYRFSNSTIEPYIVCSPSFHVEGSPLLMRISAKTTRYTFLTIFTLKLEEERMSEKVIAIDHKTGDIFEPDFTKSSFGQAPRSFYRNLPAEYTAFARAPIRLIEAYERGELQGELKEIALKLKEDDNPVLMLIKFKK
jgi:hypothetical protein